MTSAPSKILVTGASGFVGKAVMRELVARDFRVTALCRSLPAQTDDRVMWRRGDLLDAAAVATAVAGCDAVIHLVGIIRETPTQTFREVHVDGTRNVVEAARLAGVKRIVHMSALGARLDAATAYHRTKAAGEQVVMASDLDYTIFRPSMILGVEGEFTRQMRGWAEGRIFPYFMPFFGRGLVGFEAAGKLQPVGAEDVARAFIDALSNDSSIGKTYDLVGREVVDWPTMYALVSQAFTGRQKLSVGIPAWYAKIVSRLAPAKWLPFTHDQVVMSQQDNIGDAVSFERTFGWTPHGLREIVKTFQPSMNADERA